MNALLRKEAERAEVHAFYLDTLYNDYLPAAGEITTEQQEQAMIDFQAACEHAGQNVREHLGV